VSGWISDGKLAIRGFLKTPGFTAVVVATLALGIGASTAIFSLVDGILFRSMPFPEPSRVVVVWQDWTRRGGPEREWFSFQNFADVRAEDGLFSEAAAFQGWSATLTSLDEPQRVAGGQVSRGALDRVLGVTPVLGRGFLDEDDEPGAPATVLLSHGFWDRALGGDPSVVGQSLELDGENHLVIGVLPEGFEFPFLSSAEIFRPLRLSTDPAVSGGRSSIYLRVLARLAPGVSPEQAQARATALAEGLARQYPEDNVDLGIVLHPLHDEVTGFARTPLLVLLAGVGLLVSVTSVNITALLVARGLGRGPELALRSALGAGRGRLLRQAFVESTLLALAGGTLGVVLALWGTDLLVALAPPGTPRISQVSVDPRALGFVSCLVLLVGFAVGILPALQAGRRHPAEAMRGGRGSLVDARVGGRWTRSGLVAGQVMLAAVLLAGAGLVTRSVSLLSASDFGFETEGILTAQLTLPAARYADPEDRAAFFRDLVDALGARPGVEAVGAVASLPLSGLNNDSDFVVEGAPEPEPGREPIAWVRPIFGDYLQAMGIELLAGRYLAPSDGPDSTPVVLVNQALVDRYMGGEDPVGRRIGFGPPDDPNWREIVGLVEDTRHFGLDQPTRPAVYFAHGQVPFGAMGVALKASGDPLDLAPLVRQAVAELDPALAVAVLRPMSDLVRDDLSSRRMVSVLLGMFSAMAVLLATLGIYGVVSFNVTRRTHEMGVRMALGAEPTQIAALMFGSGLRLAGVGVVLGLGAAWGLTRFMQALLYGVRPGDPLTFAFAAGMLLLVASAASFLPARRVMSVDAARVMRAE
jgi:predicted permease